MHWIRRRIVIVSLMAVLATALSVVPVRPVAAQQYATHESRTGFNDEYVFAATRSVNNMEGVNPALKVPLFPLTILLDTIFLPFAVIAGFIT
jgi:uncharacterized protein YceK